MGINTAPRRAIGAIMIALAASAAYADSRECPEVLDQTVIVPANTATQFRLTVRNDNGQAVTIFQYPELGQLLRSGPSQLDYVFVPNSTFGGTTYASYRIDQPNQCPGSVQIGRVNFVVEGPPEAVVHSGDAVYTHETLCGSISVPVALPLVTGLCFVSRSRRRKRAAA